MAPFHQVLLTEHAAIRTRSGTTNTTIAAAPPGHLEQWATREAPPDEPDEPGAVGHLEKWATRAGPLFQQMLAAAGGGGPSGGSSASSGSSGPSGGSSGSSGSSGPSGVWPGLEPIEMLGVRQTSRLFEMRVPSAVAALDGVLDTALDGVLDTALIGVLPLALFASGHVHWVQRASHEALGMEPYALRPQLVPLPLTAGTESSRG